MRVVIADDEMLLREGLARLLTDAGFEVVGKAPMPRELLRSVGLTNPDVAIVDIRMPPPTPMRASSRRSRSAPRTPTRGARALALPRVDYALRLLEDHPERVGYLLKDRVSDIAVLAEALNRIADGSACSTRRSSPGSSTAPASKARSESSPIASATCLS